MRAGPDRVLVEIMDGLDVLNIDPAAKHACRNLIRAISAAHGSTGIERKDRVAFARELLAIRVSRPTVRDRLIATFDLSRAQAYRIIESALQLSQKYAGNETPQEFNSHMD